MGALVIVGVYGCIALFAMYQIDRSNKVRIETWSKMKNNIK